MKKKIANKRESQFGFLERKGSFGPQSLFSPPLKSYLDHQDREHRSDRDSSEEQARCERARAAALLLLASGL